MNIWEDHIDDPQRSAGPKAADVYQRYNAAMQPGVAVPLEAERLQSRRGALDPATVYGEYNGEQERLAALHARALRSSIKGINDDIDEED